MLLQAAHAYGLALRQHLHRIADAQAAGKHRAGDHGAEAFHHEAAVHRQPEDATIVALRQRLQGVANRLLQVRDAIAGDGRHREDRRVGQERALHQLPDVVLHQRQPLGIHQIFFGDDDEAAAHLQQIEDVQVLAGLGHHAVVRGHYEQHQVDGGDAGDHVFDEFFMAGHIDDGSGIAEMGKADVDGQAARLLLLQAIGIDAGERLDQGGLAVIDVTGGAENKMTFAHLCHRNKNPTKNTCRLKGAVSANTR